MKKLNLFNRSGMSPEVTCRKGRHAIGSILSRFSLASLICLCMLTVGVGNAWGQTQFATTSVTTTSSPYTVACTKSTGSTAPNATYGDFVRCYANNKITISTASGNPNIREIHIVWSKNSSKAFASVTAGSGSYSHPSGAGTGIWTGNASSVEFTVGSSGQIQIVSVTIYTCVKPSAIVKGTVTSSSFGLTITDAANTNNYEVYFNTSSTAPTISTTASATVTSKTPTISSGVSAGTTYYVWVRSKCSNTSKSAWVALTGNTLTTSAAACSANPSIGTAALNGSFNMTSTTSSIGVSSGTCSTGNAACDWTDYGFVWSDGANTTTPTVGGTNCNKVKVGESGTGTSWTGSITPSGSTTPTSWTTGHTYYVRTYGKNSKAGAAFVEGSAWSFTPYMVTFNKNDGGATTSTQYVQGGVSTPLTSNSFSRTGYTFNGWNTDADGTSGTGYTNGQNVSLSANLTLYAKWSAKQCTISFDIEGGTGTITNVTATYGQAMPSKESNLPTKTGYNFGGFWDGDGGTGTQYYNADGTSKINWNKDVTATQTLYAKWTVKSFTVTWMVNGEAYTTGDPSNSVDFGSHVSKLPTAPTPPCGDKFMGWTTTNIGATGQATDTGLNLFTTADSAPTISAEGNVTYYAVFADYDE